MSFDLTKMIPELEDRIGDFIDDLISGLTSETELDEWDLRDHLNENHLSTAILNAFTPMFRVAIEDLIEEKSEELAREWEDYYLPSLRAEMEADGKVDEPARRESWANFIDMKERDGDLSEFLAFHCDWDIENL